MPAFILTSGTENWVMSDDGSLIYVAGNDGVLSVYDAHTGQAVYQVALGIDLGAISLSPDGSHLAIVEEIPTNVHQSNQWTSNTSDATFYTIDLNTFGATAHTVHFTAENYTFADVAWSDADTLQLSINILPGWSGWAPLATYELATDSITYHSSYYSGLGTSASLSTIPGSDQILLGQLGLSSAEYFMIGADGESIRSNGIYNNNVYGYAEGIEAASGATNNDRIVIVTGGGAHVYTGAMTYITDLSATYPSLAYSSGVAFSDDGLAMFFLDRQNEAILVIDAYNFTLLDTVSVPGADFATLEWGEEIVIAPDGKTIYYNTVGGISVAVANLPDRGTAGNDTLNGTDHDDIIDGFAGADILNGLSGDDWLIGGLGNDRLVGGAGFDFASYETATAGVQVSLLLTDFQDTLGAGKDRLAEIEGLYGSAYNDKLTGDGRANVLAGFGGNDTLIGNGGDDDLYGEDGNDTLSGGGGVDWLFGGEGNDRLVGGVGADRMEGGNGDDVYVVDNAGDIIIETATGGNDTMSVIGMNATIVSGIETLVVSGNFSATGNFVANTLIGSNGNNLLSGLGGNDSLRGNGGVDTLDGGTGHDSLFGGAGRDTLTGGAGTDKFCFRVLADSAKAAAFADVITDFSQADHDRIDLSAIDAKAALAGNNSFSFIGNAAFSKVAGELRYSFDGAGNTFVQIDVDGDGLSDMGILLTGEIALVAGDFVL